MAFDEAPGGRHFLLATRRRGGPGEAGTQAGSFCDAEKRIDQLQASHKHRPRSLTGEAIRYALNQWAKLCVFLHDGRVQIDNNLTENAIRPSAIGKKNWLFMGDAQSGQRAATFYTLINHCHRLGIDATAYLTDIFTRLPRETNQTVHRLTPKAWAAEQAALRQAVA